MSLAEYLQLNPGSFVLVVAVLGLTIGSFLNVVIYRLPVMMERAWHSECAEILDLPEKTPAGAEPLSLVVPRSRCPHCGHGITALENIPLLSYLFLRGRCAACGHRISFRYPFVEALSALLAAAVAWHFGFTLRTATALALTWALIALSFIDLDRTWLPDSITLPFLWLGLGLSLLPVHASVEDSLIGAIAGYGVLWMVYHLFKLLTGKEGMGHGDFKLMGMLGAWLGWQSLPAIVLLSSLVGAVVGVVLILARGHDRSVPIPFGPYIAAAGWITLLWGSDLTRWYLNWSGYQ